tara:strand:+ start:47 stop:484 length:438 start_codon:yes stop_codon:yes gene_type:complete
MSTTINPDIKKIINTFKENFALFDSTQDKYYYLMDVGKQLTGLTVEEKQKKNKIIGCISESWLICSIDSNNIVQIKTDSDALIVKGLLYILEKIINGQKYYDLEKIDENNLLESLGLDLVISSQRTNGFLSAFNTAKKYIEDHVS